ncbi:hypothetical protein L207DRAFT_537025 [Hyaloscypha variabilis F]|uniref:2EXR domain-containing protein n=1 Tax=Hyaloscypha variabilis (strain UAMH 11265 / GT02V1 / F) TaxID=1149755 RepID=A0A2J6QZ63_HYAVF|nr:hypothetical protein L207DRAFT_537025 [Hyaloscypha variabilis F]
MRRFFYYTACSHPAVLHTCHESRVEGLKNYTLDFGVEDISSFPSSTFKSQPRTYVNWKVDRLCLVAPADFADSKKYGDLYEFVRLCRKKQPRFLAFNCYDDSVGCCKAMFDGQIGWREILLFSVDKYELTKQTLKKKVAFPTFTEGIPSPLVSANPRKYGETAYKNGGDIEWEDKGDIEDLLSGERTLLRLFKKHEKKLAERELEALSDDCSLPASTWRRPKIKLCIVQLKRNPHPPKDIRGLKAKRALKSSQQEVTTDTDSVADSESISDSESESESDSSSASSSEHDDESSGAAMSDLEDEDDL